MTNEEKNRDQGFAERIANELLAFSEQTGRAVHVESVINRDGDDPEKLKCGYKVSVFIVDPKSIGAYST